jgi:hypothetical protein
MQLLHIVHFGVKNEILMVDTAGNTCAAAQKFP